MRALEELMGYLPQNDKHEALAKALGSAHMLRKNGTATKHDNPNVTLLLSNDGATNCISGVVAIGSIRIATGDAANICRIATGALACVTVAAGRRT